MDRSLLCLLGVLLAGGCLQPPWDPVPAAPSAYQAALESVERGDLAAAESVLVASAACDGTEEGRGALLVLISTSLDPRNPARSPTSAMRHAVRYLRLPGTTVEGRSMATALFLVALELGGDASSVLSAASAGTAGSAAGPASNGNGAPSKQTPQAAPPLPPPCLTVPSEMLLDFPALRLDIPTVEQRVRALEAKRQELEQRLRVSESSRLTLERRLSEVAAELERIRQILRQ